MPPKKAPTKPAAGSKKTTTAAKKPTTGGAAAKADPKPKVVDYKIPDPIEVGTKQIKTVFIDDSKEQIRKADRPAALVIDNEDGIAGRFMPYSGANVFEARSVMKPPSLTDDGKESIRQAVINAIRQGKPFVIDIDPSEELTGDHDMFMEISKRFDEVESGLMNVIVDRSIIKNEWYEKLLRPDDAENLKSYYFQPENNEKFFLVIITKNQTPSKELACKFTLFKIDS